MITRLEEAMKEALKNIQTLGYIVRSARDGENIEIYWPRENEPPEISPWLDIIQADPEAFEKTLKLRTVGVPMSLVLGYPWDRTLTEWRRLNKKLGTQHNALAKTKKSYIAASIQFLKKEDKQAWSAITWEESWPISA